MTLFAQVSSAVGCATLYAQCGGKGWTGPTCCVASTCTYGNDWYHQCLPSKSGDQQTPSSPSQQPAASTGSSLKWMSGDGGLWARDCDWVGMDFASKSVAAHSCSSTCQQTTGCTHFSWIAGVCYMKGGAVGPTKAIIKKNVLCGYLTSGVGPTTTGPNPVPTTQKAPVPAPVPTTNAAPVPNKPSGTTTVTSAYSAVPPNATPYSFVECKDANNCYRRNSFLMADYGGSPAQINGDGSMSFGMGRYRIVDPSGLSFQQFHLKNRQISFTTDSSGIQCGTNSAFYLSSPNPAIGSAYCDGQNTCAEMDLYEGNIAASQFTTHECASSGDVNGSHCNKNGCAGPAGNTKFNPQLGPRASMIDTTKPFTITTQFHTTDGTDAGDLNRISQMLTQEGRVLQLEDITASYCNKDWGGVVQMGHGLDAGMTVFMSYWTGGDMSWLDGGNGNSKCAGVQGTQLAKYSGIRVSPIGV
ncbi:concanavalin A-like lectin/glucanase domain-containing protein [Chytriomyces sp. MP71]|nr:concanavalin A-like lectin/glucanase domain-containing protein [Chytriomyces sp. MP71]